MSVLERQNYLYSLTGVKSHIPALYYVHRYQHHTLGTISGQNLYSTEKENEVARRKDYFVGRCLQSG